MTYLTFFSEDEEENTKKMRSYIKKTEDFKNGLKLCPEHLAPERTLLDHLVKYENDFVGALLKLPKNLYMMFIHAYQS